MAKVFGRVDVRQGFELRDGHVVVAQAFEESVAGVRGAPWEGCEEADRATAQGEKIEAAVGRRAEDGVMGLSEFDRRLQVSNGE